MARRLDAFRGQRAPRRPIHPAEKRLLAVLAIQLVLLPWLLGTMHAWSQLVGLGLALLAFGLALQPREYGPEFIEPSAAFRLVPWQKLRRFPIFWLGLTLLAYVAVQAVNPAWRYVQGPTLWWLVPVPSVSWLPASVAAPFALFDAWRAVIIYAAAWLTACAVWIGVTRRLSLRIVLGTLTVNGLAVGAVLAAQHIEGNPHLPWPLTEWTAKSLVATFIYKNHAGSYLALVAFAAVALATWHADHGVLLLKKSTPGAALSLVAAFLGISVFFTLSRGAALTLCAALLAYAGWYLARQRRQGAGSRGNPAVTRIIAALFAIFTLVAFRYMDFSLIYDRFDAMATQGTQEESVQTRAMIHAAARTMLGEHWLRGIGAGGFRYLSPRYVKSYPEIYKGGTLYWDHAHSDWLEIPLELGLAGDLILLSGGLGILIWFVRQKPVWHPLAIPLLFGCAQTLVHAGFDFPFQCPAILVTWGALLAVAGRAVEMES